MNKVADGVHRFDVDGVNFYVIKGDDGLTVVDAGFAGFWRTFTTWLYRTGSAPREIRAVLLTHNHADHVGFAAKAQREGAEIYIHADDLEGLISTRNATVPDRFTRNLWRPRVLARTFKWGQLGVTRSSALSDVLICADGDRLDVPGTPRVVHIPGHTPGSVAYIFDDHDVICTGDALVTFDPTTGHNGLSIPPEGLNEEDLMALVSLDNLADETTSAVLPGHGEPFYEGIASAVHAARAIGTNW